MRLTIAAVGRCKPGPLRELYQEYAGRLTWPLALREIEIKKRAAAAELTRLEGDALLAVVPPGAKVAVLDERGRAMDSAGFAALMGSWRDGGTGDAVFMIGGADGHAQAVRERADVLLSFGAMTWPHMLARAMLAEQIYRAQQILAGHPYHRA